jgi:hypothetical protein
MLHAICGVRCANISVIDVHGNLQNNGVNDSCILDGEKIMYYCVNNCNRFHCISVAQKMAQGVNFSHVERDICNFKCLVLTLCIDYCSNDYFSWVSSQLADLDFCVLNQFCSVLSNWF